MRSCTVANSSLIEAIAYDETASVLHIWFRGTGKYLYHDVPAALFNAMCGAISVGGFFNAKIKDRFRCERDPARRRFGPNA